MAAGLTGNGVLYEPAELDAVERRFWRGIWSAMPTEIAEGQGVEAQDFGPVQATVAGALPEARMLNLVLGAGESGAVSGGHLDQALEWAESRGVSAYVPVTPDAPEARSAESVLRSRGYGCGYAWMKFVRGVHPPRFTEPEGVEVLRVQAAEEPFGMIAATGFGLPAWAAAFFADLHARPGWHCYLARVDDEPAACAAKMSIHGRDGRVRHRRDLGAGPRPRLPARPPPPPHNRRRLRRLPHPLCRDGRANPRPTLTQLPKHPPRRLRGGLPAA